jgi:hypothetical protein
VPALLDRVSSRKPAGKARKEEYERLQRDLVFLSESRERLIKKYAEEWVAVFDQAIVAHADEVDDLVRQLEEEGISPHQVIVDFLTKEQRALIL